MSQSSEVYRRSKRPAVALITNHGYAGVEIPIGGAADTGGQVVYVNQLALALDALGYRVTIFARGGFPDYGTEKLRDQAEYLSDHVRYVFVKGGGDTFLRKEDIAIALDEEVEWLDAFIRQEAEELGRSPWEVYEFINTHYWDAAIMGMQLVERWWDDVTATAIGELLGKSVPAETLKRVWPERHWAELGGAPAYHLGRLLMDHAAPVSGKPIERVEAVVKAYAKASGLDVSAVGGALDALRELGTGIVDDAAPVVQAVAIAETVGDAVLMFQPEREQALEEQLDRVDRHVWTPHSLGSLKHDNFRDQPLDICRELKFCERRSHERLVCDRTRAFAATSAEIAERLRTHYLVPTENVFYFPPCVDRATFREYSDAEIEATYQYLAKQSGIPAERLRESKLIFETSRMDQTKRKDLLLEAFGDVARHRDDVYLFIGGGPEKELYQRLTAMRDSTPELVGRAFLLGFIPDEHIPPLFSMADVYVSASEMEGFGMSVSQAAAARTAVVASDLIPFATQYVPDEAKIVPAGDAPRFTRAILELLEDEDDRRERAGRLADKVRALDWESQSSAFIAYLRRMGLDVAPGDAQV